MVSERDLRVARVLLDYGSDRARFYLNYCYLQDFLKSNGAVMNDQACVKSVIVERFLCGFLKIILNEYFTSKLNFIEFVVNNFHYKNFFFNKS